jgi:predicted HTH transcriptional regulator
MTEEALQKIISGGESSTVQFKERLPHVESIAHELIAFSNSHGGVIIFGINDKTGEANGLSFEEIRAINQQMVNAASQKMYPPVCIQTETVEIQNSRVVVVTVEEGLSKPYKDANGTIYVKNGADKRKVTSNAELARLLGSGGFLSADELPVFGSSVDEIDSKQFALFFQRKYNKSPDDMGPAFSNILENLDLTKNGVFTLAGLLLFSQKRHKYRPHFSVQCVSVDGSLIGNTYTDNDGLYEGTLSEVFQKTMDFIGRSMKKVPAGEGFNSPARWEIPHEVFEELIVNALVHRDYFIMATTKVFIYSDRVEIVSPGRLPNSLSIENIKNGVSVVRNPILLSAAQFVLPYKGLGTGILRVYSLYPEVEIQNLIEKNQFKVIVKRPQHP